MYLVSYSFTSLLITFMNCLLDADRELPVLCCNRKEVKLYESSSDEDMFKDTQKRAR